MRIVVESPIEATPRVLQIRGIFDLTAFVERDVHRV